MGTWLQSNLLAQAAPALAWYETWYGIAAIVAAVFAIPIVLGNSLARWLRMPDYATKFIIVLFTICAAAVTVWMGTFQFGIDLEGGTILVYEIDPEKVKEAEKNDPELMEKMVGSISERVDPAGVKQVVIRPYGQNQIEIIIPRVNEDEVKHIKNVISKAGNLEFRILADRDIGPAIVERAEKVPGRLVKDPDEPASRDNELHQRWIDEAMTTDGDVVLRNGRERAIWKTLEPEDVAAVKSNRDAVTRTTNDGRVQQLMMVGQVVAQWVKIGEEETAAGEPKKFRVGPGEGSVFRPRADGGQDALVEIDEHHVNGGYLTSARTGFREGQLAVDFNFNVQGAKRFGRLTSENIPESGRKRRLGIILDDELLSAPSLNSVIRESGQITGRFTEPEVDELVRVLNAGRLPAALARVPISEQRIDPLLGQATIESGKTAIAAALIAVLLFMPLYYRFSGLVACFALLLNLLLVLAVMVAIGAAFTLPGLAGLVLTVGMAVDANVLIFERIREETARGAALRMAIRNGFGRATRTIVDANVTTLITATVLYWIGTDQIKGFAVTLWLGIVMSMFTAIYCSRIIFDVAEKKRLITKLTMTQILGKTSFDFLGRRHIAMVGSLVLIAIGMTCVVMRGANLLDIDFLGGVKIELVFNDKQDERDVRDKLLAQAQEMPKSDRLNDLKVVGVGVDGKQFRIETTQADIGKVKKTVIEAFGKELKTNSLSYDEASLKRIPAAVGGGAAAAGGPAEVRPRPAAASGTGNNPANTSGAPPADPAAAPKDNEGSRSDLPADTLFAQAEVAPPETADVASDAAADVGGDNETSDPVTDDPKKEGPSAVKEEPTDSDAPSADQPADTAPGDTAPAAPTDTAPADTAPADTAPADTAPADTAPADTAPADTAPADTPGQPPQDPFPAAPGGGGLLPTAPGEDAPAPPRFAGGTEVDLEFSEAISRETLLAEVKDLIEKLKMPEPDYDASNPKVAVGSQLRKNNWKLQTTMSPTDTQRLLNAYKEQLDANPVFPSATTIGEQVAGNTKEIALYALIASLLCIVAYIWIRFQRVIYGLAAVVALVHDVLVTLGVIAISFYIVEALPGVAGALQLEAFKISLPILAAFLTIIGYSLNDTIVVFDRIREVRGKSPHLTQPMINDSINQTLSRTVLTSITTLLVVVLLYFIGGAGIHGFAFALVVGVIVGTYSSIFVASPSLLWMSRLGAEPRGDRSRIADRASAGVAG